MDGALDSRKRWTDREDRSEGRIVLQTNSGRLKREETIDFKLCNCFDGNLLVDEEIVVISRSYLMARIHLVVRDDSVLKFKLLQHLERGEGERCVTVVVA